VFDKISSHVYRYFNVPAVPKKIFFVIKILLALICTGLAPFGYFRIAQNFTRGSESETNVAMVLGAGIINNELPTQVLKERLEKSIDLYNQKKVSKILVSGDNSSVGHNEPEVMQSYLIKNGIPEKNIIQDYGGRRTIDSCWRAKNVFKVKNLYLVTQDFHLPRATFLCEHQGLDTLPMMAEDANLSVKFTGYIREIPASWVALWEAYGNYEPEIKGNGSEQSVN
jgi:SanA protein